MGRGWVGKGGWGVYSVCAWPWSYDNRPSHLYYAGTEHVVFSPTRQILLVHQARSAVMCLASRMKGELHPSKNRSEDGLVRHLVLTFLLMDGSDQLVTVLCFLVWPLQDWEAGGGSTEG